jgi:hypothetical protein
VSNQQPTQEEIADAARDEIRRDGSLQKVMVEMLAKKEMPSHDHH